ncbi:MAG: ABC transporter ATP-binding protein [Bacillota bacterium]
MKKIFQSMGKREWLFLGIVFLLVTAQVQLDLILPEYMSQITILVQTEGTVMSDILITGGKMIACSLVSLSLTVAIGVFGAFIATTVSMRLREQVYNKTMSFSMGDINNFSIGSLITRTTNDITQIQNFFSMGYIAIFRAPMMAVLAILKIAGKNMTFTATTAISIAVLVCVLFTVISLSMPKSKIIQKLADRLNVVTREHLTGVRVVRAYNAESYQEDKFEETNVKVKNANTFVGRATALISPFMMFTMSMLTLAIYWVGAIIINQAGAMDKLVIFSDMVVFSSYAMMIIMSFMMLSMTLLMWPRAMVALGRISEVIDFENTVKEGTKEESDVKTDVALEFKNVTFAYPGSEEPVIDGVSFKIAKGETVAFIGATGSGKTTIINLILRFYDCTGGEILVDGMNIKQYTQSALRAKFGLVTQKALLFSGDIGSNIAFGVESGKIVAEQIDTAVEISGSKDFIDKVGHAGRVSQGGLNFSGGQKQRISIARAVYKDPEIYLLDDCFSALDYKTDRNLRKALAEKTADATKLMVAQRISTVKDADQIVVLDGGKVADIGTHKNLLENSKIYTEIASSQLSKEELANG